MLKIILAGLVVIAMTGCVRTTGSSSVTGVVPYVCSGCQSEKAISPVEKVDHQKEFVLFLIKF